jgi:hypothetical protein
VYTFCFAQTRSSDEALRLCRGAVECVSARLPTLGSPSRIQSVELAELGAAFASVTPEVDVTPSLIRHAVHTDVAVIVWGLQAGARDVAAAVRLAYQSSGIEGVARMEGNLSAVIVDRAARCIWVAGTLLGHRSLFYHAAAGTFLVSPHDLTLLATGRVGFQLDPVSLASMVSTDWSLNGRSLARGIRRCHPLEAVSWRDGVLSRCRVSLPFDGPRVEPRDKAGIQRQVGRVADRMLEYVESHVGGLDRVDCSLTAGIDSRAMFAALCGVKRPGVITATTSGAERSLDVVVARRIAELAGARHQRQEPTSPTPDDFVASTRCARSCAAATPMRSARCRGCPVSTPRGNGAPEETAGKFIAASFTNTSD